MKVVILENIRSLHNVGSFLRTADGAGWDKVYFCGYTGHPPDRRIEKVSLGAENYIAHQHVPVCLELCKELKKQGFTLIALEQTEKATDLFQEKKFPDPLAVIFGNEVEGVTPEVLEICDQHLQIPMHGQKSSLNVSVAGGITLYHIKQ